jgi:hypothetical protein
MTNCHFIADAQCRHQSAGACRACCETSKDFAAGKVRSFY